MYGVLERQFRRYFKEAERRKGLTGLNLLIILESRLDNVVYRLGFADSRAQARQLVRHGHFDVNGRKTNIPSFLVKVGDVIAVRERSKKLVYFRDLSTVIEHKVIPEWLSLDIPKMEGRVLTLPTREEIDASLNEQLVVEYYSR
jgi:small subunit ribosomal protein S4